MGTNDEDAAMLIELGKQIQFARIALGLSQLQLIEATGLGDSTIRRIEKGTRSATITQLGKIAQALGITVGELAGRAEQAIESSKED